LLVTHDIEEAVIMADRIIIFDANPGRIRQQIQVELDRPREVDSPQVKRLVNQLYSLMTHKLEQELPAKEITPPAVQQQPQQAIDYRLPDIEVAQLTGVLETLVDDGITSIALAELANETHMSLDELIPLIESLELLGFAHTHGSQLSILPLGKRFAQADILDRKTLFGRQLQKNVPLANYIVSRLNFSAQKQVASEVFLEELSYYFSDEEAERVFRDVVDWGRYAELFEYDDKRELVLLPEA
jgi:NitT/TauT family transport system ATP-binding protein